MNNETFNVSLVDLRETPITKITSTGVETGSALHELDVIIYATGDEKSNYHYYNHHTE